MSVSEMFDTVTDFVQDHPYLALAIGVVAGYGVITFYQPETKSATAAETATEQEAHTQKTPGLGMSEHNLFPDFNPLANLNLQERTGIMNPVTWNKTSDVRGEPQGVRNLQLPVESSFMKNPRGTEARIDELEMKNLRKPRAIEY